MIIDEKKEYFPALTGVRIVAAYLVMLQHSNLFKEEIFGRHVSYFFSELYVGVTMFFVLSGFLIGYRYFGAIDFSFRNYMVNRIARIYPMFFMITTATFIVMIIAGFFIPGMHRHDILTVYFLNITFLRGFFYDILYSGLVQAWSLTVEETFYLLAPVFFLLIQRRLIYIFILPVLLIATGCLLVLFGKHIHYYGFMNSFEFMFNYTFFGRCCEFLAGIGLAIFLKKSTWNFRIPYCTYFGIIVIILSVFALSLLKEGPYNWGTEHPLGILINTFLMPLFGICFLFYGLVKEKTFVSDLLGSKLFVLLGKSSYIFYLIHEGIIFTFLRNTMPNSIMIFIGLNVISILLFLYMEEPLNNIIRRKFSIKKPDRV